MSAPIQTYPLGLSRFEWNTRNELVRALMETQNTTDAANCLGLSQHKLEKLMASTFIRDCEWLIKPKPGTAGCEVTDKNMDQFSMDLLVRPLAHLERLAIIAAARKLGKNKSTLADALGIGRQTLYNKIRQYNITAEEMATAEKRESN